MSDENPVGPVRPEVLCEEQAEAEFNRLAEANDLDTADLGSLASALKKVIVRSFKKGVLTLDDNDNPVFTPKYSDVKNPLTFHRPTGATLLTMDKKPDGQDFAKLFAVAAELTRTTNQAYFARMDVADSRVVLAIVNLFLV
tara:strand:- start:511 stop:933 length:423 start_codon:yes stop_codon:yes gene_type:complete